MLIASAAIIGESSHPVRGYNTPAASGTPDALQKKGEAKVLLHIGDRRIREEPRNRLGKQLAFPVYETPRGSQIERGRDAIGTICCEVAVA